MYSFLVRCRKTAPYCDDRDMGLDIDTVDLGRAADPRAVRANGHDCEFVHLDNIALVNPVLIPRTNRYGHVLPQQYFVVCDDQLGGGGGYGSGDDDA